MTYNKAIVRRTGLGSDDVDIYADEYVGGAFSDEDVPADVQQDQFAAPAVVRTRRGLMRTRPMGTRLFVPGFLGDDDQRMADAAAVDVQQDAFSGLGVLPLALASGVVSLVSGLFGSKSGKTTAAQRFVAAQQAGDTATAHTLIDQTYVHAFQQNIPDKADWVAVWNAMMSGANPDSHAYMMSKMGVATPTPTPGSTGTKPPTGFSESGVLGQIFSPVGIAIAAGLYFAFGRKR